MKNIIKIFISLLIVVSFNSCSEGDTTADFILDNVENGAVLRTIEIISDQMNADIPESEWRVSLEEQDVEDGDLFQSIELFVSLRDLTPDNGTTVAIDKFIKSIPASTFTDGPLGLPRGEVFANLTEVKAALGIADDEISGGDLLIFETKLVLTNGKVYGKSSAAGIITGGFFSSPFQYNALLLCAPEPGNYKVIMVDNYGDGWQGTAIRINIDGDVTEITFPSYWDCESNCGSVGDPRWVMHEVIVNIPVDTELATWEFVQGNYPGEDEFEIFAPDGTSFGYFGPSAAPGILPVVQCLGTGGAPVND